MKVVASATLVLTSITTPLNPEPLLAARDQSATVLQFANPPPRVATRSGCDALRRRATCQPPRERLGRGLLGCRCSSPCVLPAVNKNKLERLKKKRESLRLTAGKSQISLAREHARSTEQHSQLDVERGLKCAS